MIYIYREVSKIQGSFYPTKGEIEPESEQTLVPPGVFVGGHIDFDCCPRSGGGRSFLF